MHYIAFLFEAIEQLINSKLTHAEKFLIDALPFRIQDELYKQKGNELFKVNGFNLPYIILDNTSLERYLGGPLAKPQRFTEDDITAVRTQLTGSGLVLLSQPGYVLQGSLSTTFYKLEDPFNIALSLFLDETEYANLPSFPAVINRLASKKETSVYSIAEAKWDLFTRITHFHYTFSLDLGKVYAIIGLPSKTNEKNWKEAIKIIQMIGNDAIAKGLAESFEGYRRIAQDLENNKVIIEALDLCYMHILKEAGEGATFAQDPFKYYAIDELNDIDEWWSVLDFTVWERIFDQHEEKNRSVKLAIRPINEIYYDSISNAYLFNSHISLETDENSNWSFKRKVLVEDEKTISIHPDEIDDGYIYTIKADQSYRQIKAEGKIDVFSFDNNLVPLYLICQTANRAKKPKKKSNTFTYDIELKGQGYHNLVVLLRNDWSIKNGEISGVDISSMDQIQKQQFIILDNSNLLKGENVLKIYSVEIFSDEESSYAFSVINNKTDEEFKIKLELFAEEGNPSFVDSNFQRLKLLNLKRRTSNPEILRQNLKIYELEKTITQCDLSYYPCVVSVDFPDYYFPPSIPKNRILTKYRFIAENDPRPTYASFDLLKELVHYRTELLEQLASISKNSEGYNIEDIELNSHIELEKKIIDYISCYHNLLLSEHEETLTALSWFDVIGFFPLENASILASAPIAIFFSPFHPLNLAWQYYAQNVLSKTLIKNKLGCPIASIVSSNNISCHSLAVLQNEYKNFLSLNTNLDYWKVLWNSDHFQDLEKAQYINFFNRLNIKLSGLEQGVKSSQVKKAINQINTLTIAKDKIEILVIGTPEHSGEVNHGIIEWAEERLLPENEDNNIDCAFWDRSTIKSLDIYDLRSEAEQPENDILSNLINEKKIPLSWYTKQVTTDKLDLGFITKLDSVNKELKLLDKRGFSSCISKGGLLKYGLTTQVGSSSIYESQISSFDSPDNKDFGNTISSAISKTEQRVNNKSKKNAFYHSPNNTLISEVLSKAHFCAVSSSLVDVSYFAGAKKDYLLWEFVMPSYDYSRDGRDGYYLLSDPSDGFAIQLFNRKLDLFDTSIGNEVDIPQLLKNLSNRGLMQLRDFLLGGSNYVGDIGVLVAVSALQPINAPSNSGLFPIIGKESINLVIPIDPFQERIQALKRAIEFPNLNRPDLLLISISEDNIYLIPIEIKCRTDILPTETLNYGLKDQAISFTNFLINLNSFGDGDTLWSMAFPSLISEMILFSYNIYNSILNEDLKHEFAKINISKVINQILNKSISICFDNIGGRLITVSNHNGVSYFDNLDDDHFNETLHIDKKDIKRILKGEFGWLSSAHGYENSWLFQSSCNGENKLATEDTSGGVTKVANEGKMLINGNPTPGVTPVEVPPKSNRTKLSYDLLEDKYDKLLMTFDEHQVKVRKTDNDQFVEGPASILFKIIPSRGVRISKIESLHDELKLNLGLRKDQNIDFSIDEGTINIDLPKKEEERYFIDAIDLWEKWQPRKDHLEIAIGENRYGKLISLDFSSSNSPHLLIGGQTGSGKSEALNTILGGLVQYYSMEALRLILVDPKGTELLKFEQSPHLLGNIGINDAEAIEFLKIAVAEMGQRYERFAQARARSLPEFNASQTPAGRLPWWVIVLDEYGDLTSDPNSKKEIEALLKRIAQKGRASGIHLIVTTQNPNSEVINTTIRSNLPAQLALRVRSKTESNIIISRNGAETLNGKGDAILNTGSSFERIQCAIYKG